jgi:hypothetical protein
MHYDDGSPIEPRQYSVWRYTLPDGTEHLAIWHANATFDDVHCQLSQFHPVFTLMAGGLGDFTVRTEHAYYPDSRRVDQDREFVPFDTPETDPDIPREFLIVPRNFAPDYKPQYLKDPLPSLKTAFSRRPQTFHAFEAWSRTCKNGDTFTCHSTIVICVLPGAATPLPRTPETPTRTKTFEVVYRDPSGVKPPISVTTDDLLAIARIMPSPRSATEYPGLWTWLAGCSAGEEWSERGVLITCKHDPHEEARWAFLDTLRNDKRPDRRWLIIAYREGVTKTTHVYQAPSPEAALTILPTEAGQPNQNGGLHRRLEAMRPGDHFEIADFTVVCLATTRRDD